MSKKKTDPMVWVLLLGGGGLLAWAMMRPKSATTPAATPLFQPIETPEQQPRPVLPAPVEQPAPPAQDDAEAREQQAAVVAVQEDQRRRDEALREAARRQQEAEAAEARAQQAQADLERARAANQGAPTDSTREAEAEATARANQAATDAEQTRGEAQQARDQALDTNGTLTPQAAADMLNRYLRSSGANWGWKGNPSDTVRKAQEAMGLKADGIFGPGTRSRMVALGVTPPPASQRRVSGVEVGSAVAAARPLRLDLGSSDMLAGIAPEVLVEGVASMLMGSRPPEECPEIGLDAWVGSAHDLDTRQRLIEGSLKGEDT